MKEKIESNINSPAELEVLYQQDSTAFEKAFRELSTELKQSPVVDFWVARLNYKAKKDGETKSKPAAFNYYDLLFLIGAVLIGWAFIKIPDFTHINSDLFMMRNATLSVLPAIAIYWIWKRKIPRDNILPLAVLSCASIVFINLFPVEMGKYSFVPSSDTFLLSCLCFPILLWIAMGIFLREEKKSVVHNLAHYIPLTGEIAITSFFIALAWGAVVGIATALFSTIGFFVPTALEQIWIPIVISIPVIAVLLTENYPKLTQVLTSILARGFAPVVLLILMIFLVTMIESYIIMKPVDNLFEDHDFLVIFNVVLLASTALVLFSLGTLSKVSLPRWVMVSNALLSATSVILTLAVIYFLISRAFTGGITPNRFAALGVDAILGVQLTAIAYQLFSLDAHKSTFDALKKAMTIPFYYYGIWAAFVIFAFPLIFHFK